MHLLIIILLIVSPAVIAQSVSTRMGARPAGMGNAGFGVADPSALFQNPGSLARIDRSILFFGQEAVPGLAGGNRSAAALLVATSFGTLGVGAFRFGDQLYSEQFLTTGFGHRLGDTSLGLKGNFIQYRADGFGTRTAFTVDVGGLTQLTPEWSVGAGILNVNQASLTSGETLPVVFVTAVSWKPMSGPLLTLEAEKSFHVPLNIRGGMEVTFREKIFGRAGFSLEPLTLSAGVGFRTSRLGMDFAATYHRVFTFLYQASASCQFQKKKPSR